MSADRHGSPGLPALRELRTAPVPGAGCPAGFAAYEPLTRRLVEFLFTSQVTTVDSVVALAPGPGGELSGTLTTRPLRGSAEPLSVPLIARAEGGAWRVWSEHRGERRGPLSEGELFRVDLVGRVSGLPGFRGVRPPAGGPVAWLKAGLRRFRPTARAMVKARLLRFERLPAFELSEVEGVTWRLRRIDPAGRRLDLEAYDAGGIYDRHLNSEGVRLPPQVAGNQYADAYAAYAFAWHYRQGGGPAYLEAARAALAFVRRVYPQYAATAFAFHHSDFKNPAFLETVESLLAPAGLLDADELAVSRALIGRFAEGTYNPTNVFALRFHWRAARAAVATEDEASIERCLARVRRDQTAEGLIQDNYVHYPDAHDLTYHQYSLASLAQGLAWRDDPEACRRFLAGAALSLALTTPDGEIAYVGRGGNNVYHVASAVLAFEAAARLRAYHPAEAGAYRRGARLLAEQLAPWQQPDGMLPTAMNRLVAERVAWNHCETPYNALVATLLQKAARLHEAPIEEAPLPMDRPGYLRVLDDSGFAAVRTDDLYGVVFSGCAPSYLWSGRTHRTGVAGLAQLGLAGRGALLPILDHPPAAGPGAITDLPLVSDAAAFGRGALRAVAGPVPTIHLRHRYGGADVDRLYAFVGRTVVVATRVRPVGAHRGLTVRGLVAAAFRADDGWTVSVTPSGQVRAAGPGGAVVATVLHVSSGLAVAPRMGPTVTNPRGRAVRVDLVDATARSASDPALACHALSAEVPGEPVAPPPTASCPEPGCLAVVAGAVRFTLRFDGGPGSGQR